MFQQNLNFILQQAPTRMIARIFFSRELGIYKASETYRRQIIIEDQKGGTGKSTLRRILRIVLGARNYVSLDSSFSTKKRANSLTYTTYPNLRSKLLFCI